MDDFEGQVRAVITAVLSDPVLSVPDAFKAWMLDQPLLNPSAIPFSQVIGAPLWTPQVAPRINAAQATTSTTYTNLTTVGPQITGLADGKYEVLYGAEINASQGYASVKYGTAEAVDADSISNTAGGTKTLIGSITVSLTGGGNNTILMRYRSADANSASFANRWMRVARYANL